MWTNPQETADLVTFTEEVFIGKLHFLMSGKRMGSFPLSNSCLDVFTLKDLLGLEKI